MICDFNCGNCKFEDCINDNLTMDDFKRSNSLDTEIKDETLSSIQLAKKRSNMRYREKNKDKLRANDRERYQGERKEVNRKRSSEYYLDNKEELNARTMVKYYEKKLMVE